VQRFPKRFLEIETLCRWWSWQSDFNVQIWSVWMRLMLEFFILWFKSSIGPKNIRRHDSVASGNGFSKQSPESGMQVKPRARLKSGIWNPTLTHEKRFTLFEFLGDNLFPTYLIRGFAQFVELISPEFLNRTHQRQNRLTATNQFYAIQFQFGMNFSGGLDHLKLDFSGKHLTKNRN